VTEGTRQREAAMGCRHDHSWRQRILCQLHVLANPVLSIAARALASGVPVATPVYSSVVRSALRPSRSWAAERQLEVHPSSCLSGVHKDTQHVHMSRTSETSANDLSDRSRPVYSSLLPPSITKHAIIQHSSDSSCSPKIAAPLLVRPITLTTALRLCLPCWWK